MASVWVPTIHVIASRAGDIGQISQSIKHPIVVRGLVLHIEHGQLYQLGMELLMEPLRRRNARVEGNVIEKRGSVNVFQVHIVKSHSFTSPYVSHFTL